MFFNLSLAAALAASIATTSALPKSNQNWETVTNELGYETPRFKSGFEPGSEDYSYRFGGANASALMARQEGRTTSPYVGKTRIPYGCNTDIGNYVFSHLYELCDDDRCDGGSSASVDVTYPDSGIRKDASIGLSVTGQYPHGSKEHMLRAIQAMVPQNGVDYYDVTSYGPQIGGFAVPKTALCEVVGSSNFFSVVIRNDDDDSLVGLVDVSVTFELGENAAICGTIATVAKEIAGAINGIAGALFGVVQAVSCK